MRGGVNRRRESKRRKAPGRKTHGKKEGLGERGVAWLVLLPYLFMFAGVLAMGTFGEDIGREIGSSGRMGTLLVHVPSFEMEGAQPEPVLGKISSSMSHLYSLSQKVAAGIFVVVLFFVGVTYLLEQTEVVPRETSMRIVSNSVLVIIAIVVFPYIWNLTALGFNTLNEKYILGENNLHPDTVTGELGAATMAYSVTEVPVLEQLSKGVLSLFVGAICLMSIVLAVVAGVFRYVFLGVLAASFPIFLVMELIPLMRGIGQTVRNTLVGLLASSVLISMFLRLACELVRSSDGVLKWVLGFGSLTAVAMLSTFFAPSIGGVVAGISRQVVGAGAAAVAGGVHMGVGALAGGAGAASTVAAAGVGGAGAGFAGRAFLSGATRGALTGAMAGGVLPAITKGKEVGAEAGEAKLIGRYAEAAPGQLDRTERSLLHPEYKREYENMVSSLSPEKRAYLHKEGDEYYRTLDDRSDEEILLAYGRIRFGPKFNNVGGLRRAAQEWRAAGPKEVRVALKNIGKQNRAYLAYLLTDRGGLKNRYSHKVYTLVRGRNWGWVPAKPPSVPSPHPEQKVLVLEG